MLGKKKQNYEIHTWLHTALQKVSFHNWGPKSLWSQAYYFTESIFSMTPANESSQRNLQATLAGG